VCGFRGLLRQGLHLTDGTFDLWSGVDSAGSWVDVRIGFDMDQATLLEDWTSMLSEDKHVFYVSTLQLPHTKEEHMLKQ